MMAASTSDVIASRLHMHLGAIAQTSAQTRRDCALCASGGGSFAAMGAWRPQINYHFGYHQRSFQYLKRRTFKELGTPTMQARARRMRMCRTRAPHAHAPELRR